MVSCLCFGSRPAKKLKDNSSSKSRRDKSSTPARPATPLSDDFDSESEQGVKTKAQIFPYSELATATRNFRPESLIGQGGFGTVYRGRLDTGQKIAVKMLDPSGAQGDNEFLVETLMLSHLNHENLVHLYGYCAEGDKRGLVYEYMPLGSLDDHIYDLIDGREPLDWTTRIQIAMGAAKGLEYLHNEAEPHVIYRDLKTSNILLGHGYKPKLSDFGLAKFGPTGDMSHVSTRIMGTLGYCSPGYATTGKVTLKSDIYSFGVVLLELITGKKALVSSSACVDGKSRLLTSLVNDLYVKGEIRMIADPLLSTKGGFSEPTVKKAVEVALMCVNDDPKLRPEISEVVRALDYIAGYPSRKQNKKRSIRTGSDEAGTSRMLEITEEEAEEEAKERLERERDVAEAFAWARPIEKRVREADRTDQPPKPSPP